MIEPEFLEKRQARAVPGTAASSRLSPGDVDVNHRRAWPIVMLLILSFSLSLHAVAQAHPLRTDFSARGALRRVGTRPAVTGRDLLHIRTTREAASRKYAVIFIPGMLGSQLIHPKSGNVIWGEGRPSVAALALDEWAPSAKAEILETYWRDMHGVLAQTLEGMLGDQEVLLRFAYDWRHDIDRIAQWFDERVRSTDWREELKDKSVHIIAHSLGGLVAGRWKHRYYATQKQRYPFDLASMVVLGSPIQGSCDLLYMLLSGYGQTAGVSEVLNYGFKRFFEAAHAAAFTFPSVFQSLPKFDPTQPDRSCVVANPPTLERGGRDHFLLSLWETALVPHLGRRSCYLVVTCPPWDDLAMSKERFLDLLARMLETGRKFRESATFEETPHHDGGRHQRSFNGE